jgi:hypothetical protein
MNNALPFQEQSWGEADSPETRLSDVAEASWELANMDTWTNNVIRNQTLSDLEADGGKVLTPEQLNEKYKNVEVKFNKPTNEKVAFILDEEGQRRNQLKEIISKGPALSGFTNFTTTLAAHAADPLELTAGLLTGFAFRGVGAVAGGIAAKTAASATAGAGASKLAAIATKASKLGQGGIGQEIAENFIGNVPSEVYAYTSAQKAQVDQSIQGSLASIAAGTLAIPALKYGVKTSLNGLSKLAPEIAEVKIKDAIAKVESGKLINDSNIEKMVDDVHYGKALDTGNEGPDRLSYEYKARSTEEIKLSPMYAASNKAGNIEGGTKAMVEDFGDGIYLTDNPSIANNFAANEFSSAPSSVHKITASEVNLINRDTPLDASFKETLIKDVGEKTVLGKALKKAETLKEAMNSIREKIDNGTLKAEHMDRMYAAIKKNGYDGFHGAHEGIENPHNYSYIFPESKQKIKETEMFRPDKKAVKKINKDTLNKISEPYTIKENDVFYDKDVQIHFEAAPKLTPEISKLSSNIETSLKELDSVANSEGINVKGLKENIETAKGFMRMAKELPAALSEFANCIISGAV